MKKGPSCVVSLLASAMNSRRGPTDGDQGSTRPPSLLFLQSQILGDFVIHRNDIVSRAVQLSKPPLPLKIY